MECPARLQRVCVCAVRHKSHGLIRMGTHKVLSRQPVQLRTSGEQGPHLACNTQRCTVSKGCSSPNHGSCHDRQDFAKSCPACCAHLLVMTAHCTITWQPERQAHVMCQLAVALKAWFTVMSR